MIERVSLAHLPTPIEELPQLAQIFGGARLFIKRDDLTGLGIGGNKTRKLEFLAGDALAQGADMLVSTGAVQSNHCRQVAAAAAKLGLDCLLVLAGEEPRKIQGNYLLDRLSGAKTVFTTKAKRDQTLQNVVDQARQSGRRPYLIPYGGSNAVGALGYFEAMRELVAQNLAPDWVVFASSSGGTQAGLILGARQTGFQGKLLGISIEFDSASFAAHIADLANQAASLCGLNESFSIADVLIRDDYCKAGYGVITAAEVEAVRLFAQKAAILLDPVYTGRAAAGLLDLARKGFFKTGERVLFWHTGGTPALFVEPYSSGLLND